MRRLEFAIQQINDELLHTSSVLSGCRYAGRQPRVIRDKILYAFRKGQHGLLRDCDDALAANVQEELHGLLGKKPAVEKGKPNEAGRFDCKFWYALY